MNELSPTLNVFLTEASKPQQRYQGSGARCMPAEAKQKFGPGLTALSMFRVRDRVRPGLGLE